jgi:hypothetical protein
MRFANRTHAQQNITRSLVRSWTSLQDTNTCLELSDYKNVKAWYRKGQALEGLSLFAEVKNIVCCSLFFKCHELLQLFTYLDMTILLFMHGHANLNDTHLQAKEAYETGLKIMPSSSQLKLAIDKISLVAVVAAPSSQPDPETVSVAQGEGNASPPASLAPSTQVSDAGGGNGEVDSVSDGVELKYSIKSTKSMLTVAIMLGRDSMRGVHLHVQRSSFRYWLLMLSGV